MNGFRDRVAIVTGGTRGVGREIVLDLARRGTRVAFSYQRSDDLARTLEKETASLGVPAPEGSDFGDLGFCAQLCDCNEDCANQDFVCLPVGGLDTVAGRAGACGPPTSASRNPVGIPCQ